MAVELIVIRCDQRIKVVGREGKGWRLDILCVLITDGCPAIRIFTAGI
jgi:hypothetical protein